MGKYWNESQQKQLKYKKKLGIAKWVTAFWHVCDLIDTQLVDSDKSVDVDFDVTSFIYAESDI